jgi:hypothetical protein
MLYRVTWSVSGIPGREVMHEYIASMEDAHALWHHLTSRSGMESAYRRVGEERGTASVLYRPEEVVHTVRVCRITGREVCPEMGLSGMDCDRAVEGDHP